MVSTKVHRKTSTILWKKVWYQNLGYRHLEYWYLHVQRWLSPHLLSHLRHRKWWPLRPFNQQLSPGLWRRIWETRTRKHPQLRRFLTLSERAISKSESQRWKTFQGENEGFGYRYNFSREERAFEGVSKELVWTFWIWFFDWWRFSDMALRGKWFFWMLFTFKVQYESIFRDTKRVYSESASKNVGGYALNHD